MRAFVSGLLAFLLAAQPFALAAKPTQKEFAQKEAWHLFLAHLVAYQPRNVGIETYLSSLGLKSYTGPGRELSRAAKQVKTWPTLSIKGDALEITDAAGRVVLMEKAKDGALMLNGRLVKLDTKKPLLPQMKGILSPASVSFIPSPFSSARAEEESVTGSGIPEALLGTGVVSAATGHAVMTFGIIGSVAGGAIAAVGIAGTAACSIAIASGNIKGPSPFHRVYNCLAKPFQWAKWTDRFNLFLRDIKCEKDVITVVVESDASEREVRSFRLSDGRLTQVDMKNTEGKSVRLTTGADGNSFTGGETSEGKKLSMKANRKELAEAQELITNFTYYKGVCARYPDGSYARELNRQLQKGEKVPAYDKSDVEGLSNSAF